MNFRDLSLSADQKTKIEYIRKAYRSKVHADGNKLRTTVHDELGKIIAVMMGARD